MLHFDDDASLLHMGDTDIFSDMALINELHQPDIGIVPIGDRFTMGGAVAALACQRYFNFKTVIPCHYKTFPLLEQSAQVLIDALSGVDVIEPKVMEAIAADLDARSVRVEHMVLAAGVLLAIGTAFLLVWANLAVGIVDEPEHPANLMFAAVLLVGVVGAAGFHRYGLPQGKVSCRPGCARSETLRQCGSPCTRTGGAPAKYHFLPCR